MNNLVLNFCFFVCDPNTIILGKFLDEWAMAAYPILFVVRFGKFDYFMQPDILRFVEKCVTHMQCGIFLFY
jgi:hypothetical protein